MADMQDHLTAEPTVVADASYSSMWIVGQLRALRAGIAFCHAAWSGRAWLGITVWRSAPSLPARSIPSSRSSAMVGLPIAGPSSKRWSAADVSVVAIVLNNGVLGYQKDAETAKFGRCTTACRLGSVSHAEIARACGCEAICIDAPGDLTPALKAALESVTPMADRRHQLPRGAPASFALCRHAR